MKLLVLTVCIAMIAVQAQRLRLGPSIQRVLFLLFWLTVVAWALTSKDWLAYPAVALLLAALFWNIGPLLALFGSAALAGRVRKSGSRDVSHVLYRSPLLARARNRKLIRLLHHRDENVRWAAIAEMGSRQDPELTPVLLELAEKDPDSRADAITALGRSGDTTAASRVLGYLLDDDEMVRQAAVGCLAALRNPETVEELGEFLDSTNRENHTRGAYNALTNGGGAAAIGWVWGGVSDGVRRTLLGWLRGQIDEGDEEAPGAVETALAQSEGDIRRSVGDAQRHILCLELQREHPEWFEEVDSDHLPVPTAQSIQLDTSGARELGLAVEPDMEASFEAQLLVEPRSDGTLLCRLQVESGSYVERQLPQRMLVGLLVQASQEPPLRFRHENPDQEDEPFDRRPLVLGLPLAMDSSNLAHIQIEGVEFGIKSDFRQKAVVDVAVTRTENKELSVRIRNWASHWDRQVPPFVGEIELTDLFVSRLVDGMPDPPTRTSP